jgi:preprotein translocase subunit SecD
MHNTKMIIATLMLASSTQVAAQNEPTHVARLSAVHEAIDLKIEDIAGLEITLNGKDSAISLSLGIDATHALAELTRRNLNREMTFTVCEKIIFQAFINATINSGLINATSNESNVLSMSKVLSGEIGCVEYLRQ